MADTDTHSSLVLVARAAAYAAEAHVNQKRKAGDEPYINHPLRVAQAAAEAGLDAEAIAAALLHDVVEDTDRTLEALAGEFPPRVVDLVQRLTKWWPDDAPQAVKQAGNPPYYDAIREAPDAVTLKLLDRADNLWSMVRMLPHARSWAARYHCKSLEEVAPLAGACANARAVRAFEDAVAALAAELDKKGAQP